MSINYQSILSAIEKDICNMKCGAIDDKAKYEAYGDVQKYILDVISSIRDCKKVTHKSPTRCIRYHINNLLGSTEND